MTATFDLTGWRNTPFPPDLIQLALDDAGEVPVNLSGKSFAMDVRAIPGEGPALISLDLASDDAANGVRVVNAANGDLRLQIDKPTMQAAWDAAFAAGLMKAGEAAVLFYDLLVIGADSFIECVLEGRFIILPGSTL